MDNEEIAKILILPAFGAVAWVLFELIALSERCRYCRAWFSQEDTGRTLDRQWEVRCKKCRETWWLYSGD